MQRGLIGLLQKGELPAPAGGPPTKTQWGKEKEPRWWLRKAKTQQWENPGV